MDIAQRETELVKVKAAGRATKEHLFKVRKRMAELWHPIPGDNVSSFLGGDYDVEYVGPMNDQTLQENFGGPKEKADKVKLPA